MVKKEVKEPEFNSGIAYLERIDNLIRQCHNANVEGDYSKFFSTLTSLFTEIDPRMIDDDVTTSELLEKNCFKLVSNISPDPSYNHLFLRNKLLSWFRFLNRTAHKLKLIMPDKGSGADATRL